MPQVINTNITSLNAQRNLNVSDKAQSQAIQRLSSGLRINSAKDDAAGLAISDRMTSQIRGLNQAMRNANDGVSLGQVAEGALGAVGDALQRIRELSVQSANATNSSSDRAALNAEVTQLVGEITRIGDTASFNGLKILDGTYLNQQFQIGANAGQTLGVSLVDSRAVKLGATVKASTEGVYTTGLDLTTGITLNGTAIATTGLTTMSELINKINESQGTTGVTATRATSNSIDTGAFTAADATVTVNGTAISLVAATQTTAALAATRINEFSTQTGVTATVAAGQIVLSNGSGADITVLDDTDGTNANVFGLAAITSTAPAATFTAGIELSTSLGGTITAAGTLGTTLKVAAATAVDYKVSSTSVTTIANANNAIKAVDFALTQVSKSRADLGAVQRRFESIITDLSANAENLTASRSRVMDTDFAAETANLTRAQILQQAGIAMLAQANALPQNVLALLRG